MVRNFVLAFGGTGARCAEAICYLCAAGVWDDDVHVLILDPDNANGNKTTAVAQMESYSVINRTLKATDRSASTRPFFSTALNAGRSLDSFVWGHPQSAVPFGNLIGYPDLRPQERDLLDLLYDERDLTMVFQGGYYGRASVGSLDMYRTLRDGVSSAADQVWAKSDDSTENADGEDEIDDPLRAFLSALRNAAIDGGGARVAIVGSVFGGTGASGLPVMPTFLAEALSRDETENVRIAAVQMTPYFTFPKPSDPNDPDPATHPLATRTALYHYARNPSGYDRLYLIGAPIMASTNSQNKPEGEKQKNRAHYAEIGSALAVDHFFGGATTDASEVQVWASGAEVVDWPSMPAVELLKFRRAFASLTTLCSLHHYFVAEELRSGRFGRARWQLDLRARTKASLSRDSESVRALSAFAHRFLQWADEVQRTALLRDTATRELFTIPSKNDAANSLGTIVPGGGSAAYHELYSALDRCGEYDQEHALGWYLAAASEAANAFCAANYSWWS